MLVPIQTSGNKPPLFFIHGVHGDMPLGTTFSRVLGAHQPVYAIYASGMDGRRPVIDNMPDMVRAYADEIQEVRPAGPIRIGGMCTGCLIALESARKLQEAGRQTGPV